MARKRIGELLLEKGYIDRAQLEDALLTHRQTRQRLGVVLIQKGYIDEDRLVTALAGALGIPRVDLGSPAPEWSAIHSVRARLCETHDLFPYALEERGGRKLLIVAMSDPLNIPAIEEIEFVTGLQVSPRIAPLSQIRKAILRWYHKVDPEEPTSSGLVLQHGGATVQLPLDDEPTKSEVAEPSPDDVDVDLEPSQPQPPPPGVKGTPLPSAALDEMNADLRYLFDLSEDDPLGTLEEKFWALLRLLAKKGLITNEEFNRELAQGTRSGERVSPTPPEGER